MLGKKEPSYASAKVSIQYSQATPMRSGCNHQYQKTTLHASQSATRTRYRRTSTRVRTGSDSTLTRGTAVGGYGWGSVGGYGCGPVNRGSCVKGWCGGPPPVAGG